MMILVFMVVVLSIATYWCFHKHYDDLEGPDTLTPPTPIPQLQGRIVPKPWGQEEIWAETPDYLGKVLTIEPHQQLSLQYHSEKNETIKVMLGPLFFEYGYELDNLKTVEMQAGECIHIAPNLIHRMKAKDNPVMILEVSTGELNDVVRIQDSYGRS